MLPKASGATGMGCSLERQEEASSTMIVMISPLRLGLGGVN